MTTTKTANFILIAANAAVLCLITIKTGLGGASAYFMAMLGFYLSLRIREAALIFAIPASYIYAASMWHLSPSKVVASIIFFFALAALPFYFSIRIKRSSERFAKIKSALYAKRGELSALYYKTSAERKKREEEYDRMLYLYIVVKDMSNDVDNQDFINTISRGLLDKPGIESVNIFGRKAGKWDVVFCQQPKYEPYWLE